MPSPPLKDRIMQIPFGLASTAHGTMILPLNDWHQKPDNHVEVGVGLKVLLDGVYDESCMPVMMAVLNNRRKRYGDGVVMLDGGANVGCYTVSFARAMQGWGEVWAFEAQERIFYALCGNIAMNNVMNAQAFYCALYDTDGAVEFPTPNYSIPGNYGGLNVAGLFDIGQKIETKREVLSKRIDSLNLDRLDFLKLDIEGMELKVLDGALETIKRCRPFIMAEHARVGIKSLEAFFHSVDYVMAASPMDVFAAGDKNEIIEALKVAQ